MERGNKYTGGAMQKLIWAATAAVLIFVFVRPAFSTGGSVETTFISEPESSSLLPLPSIQKIWTEEAAKGRHDNEDQMMADADVVKDKTAETKAKPRDKETQQQGKQTRLKGNLEDAMNTDKIGQGAGIEKADDTKRNEESADLLADGCNVSAKESWKRLNSRAEKQADETNDSRGAGAFTLTQEIAKQRPVIDARLTITERLLGGIKLVRRPVVKFAELKKALEPPLEPIEEKSEDQDNTEDMPEFTEGETRRRTFHGNNVRRRPRRESSKKQILPSAPPKVPKQQREETLDSNKREINRQVELSEMVASRFSAIPKVESVPTEQTSSASDHEATGKHNCEDQDKALRERILKPPSVEVNEVREGTHEHRVEFQSKFYLQTKGVETVSGTVQSNVLSTRKGTASAYGLKERKSARFKDTPQRKENLKDLTLSKEIAEKRRILAKKETRESEMQDSEIKTYDRENNETKNLKVKGRGSLIGLSSSLHTIPVRPAAGHKPVARSSSTSDVLHRQRRSDEQKCSGMLSYGNSYRGSTSPTPQTNSVPSTKPTWHLGGPIWVDPYAADSFVSAKSAPRTKHIMPVVSRCPAGKVFDHNLDTCRPGIISPPMTANLNKFAVAMWITPYTPLHQSSFTKQDFIDALTDFAIELSQVSSIYIQTEFSYSIVSFHLAFNGEDHIVTGDATYQLGNFTKAIYIKLANVDYCIYKVTSRLLACVDIQEFGANEYTVLPETSPAVYITKSRQTFYSYQYFANKTKKENGRVFPIGDILVCKLHLTANCSGVYIPLQEHEYVVLPNGSLYRNISRESFELGSYDLKNKTAWICTNWSTSYNEIREIVIHYSNINHYVLIILSCIGLSLSIFSLVLFLLTYSLFSELRTLPGINMMNLSVSLLLLHSIWFATSETHEPIICSIVAALIHYLTLVSFTWMSIIAFDMWKIFSTTIPRAGPQHGVKRTKIIRFMALGWIPVLIFVIICVVLDQTETFNVGYGGEESCLINSEKANKFLFVLPIAVSLAFNTIFFVKTVCVLRKAKKQTQTASSHARNRRSFWIYVRLASLMGFTWIFGFLALLISEYLLYPFVIFNTLQGVYITGAFVFKARVKQLYGQLLFSNTKQNPEVKTQVVIKTKPRRKCKVIIV